MFCTNSSRSKSCPLLRKRVFPSAIGEHVFLDMSPHTASQKHSSIDWSHVSFPASSMSLPPLQGPQTWQPPPPPPKHGQHTAARNPGQQLHFMASSTPMLPVVFTDEAANGEKWWSIGPAFVEQYLAIERALTQTSNPTRKFATHTSRRLPFSV